MTRIIAIVVVIAAAVVAYMYSQSGDVDLSQAPTSTQPSGESGGEAAAPADENAQAVTSPAQETAGAAPPPPGHTGLHHVAFLVPDRAALAAATRRLAAHGCPPVSGWDHGATVSVYVRDPDGHTIELYFDRARAHWYDAHGRPVLRAERFDPRDLLDEPLGAA